MRYQVNSMNRDMHTSWHHDTSTEGIYVSIFWSNLILDVLPLPWPMSQLRSCMFPCFHVSMACSPGGRLAVIKTVVVIHEKVKNGLSRPRRRHYDITRTHDDALALLAQATKSMCWRLPSWHQKVCRYHSQQLKRRMSIRNKSGDNQQGLHGFLCKISWLKQATEVLRTMTFDATNNTTLQHWKEHKAKSPVHLVTTTNIKYQFKFSMVNCEGEACPLKFNLC